MDTSKDYYESVMLQFRTYGRGRTLEQFCRDEGADYRWIAKAADLYGTPEKEMSQAGIRENIRDSYHHTVAAPAAYDRSGKEHFKDRLNHMHPEWEKAHRDTMDIIRRRNEFCDRWREETVRDAKEGRISMDEFLAEMDRIKVEMDRTRDALEQWGDAIKKWKIKD